MTSTRTGYMTMAGVRPLPGAVLLRNDDQDFHHVAHAACLDAVTFAVEGDLSACLSKEG